MREIKFRAWDKNKRNMLNNVIPFFNQHTNELDYLVTDYHPSGYGMTELELEYDGFLAYEDDENMPYEVMQYTGLKDKTHLKDIVFGDVVIVDSPKGPFKAKITQEVGAFGIVAIDGQIIDYFPDNWNDDFMALLDLYWNFNNDDNVIEEFEVIGNIYENPELLKTKKSS
ncbi:YopX family protein [Vagococcus fluvialis]|uniref:YopX family protein n=1 Tax=Vagococcus fluvialis TaxID=2738 RepID=UPI00379D7BB5